MVSGKDLCGIVRSGYERCICESAQLRRRRRVVGSQEGEKGFPEEKIMASTMTAIETMKAVRIHAFGGPEVLRYEEVPGPEPKAHQMLVRVHAAGVNPVDWKIREGLLGQDLLPPVMRSDLS